MKKVEDNLKLKLRQVCFSDLIWNRISEFAANRGMSASAVIRKAVIRFLKESK
jgi:hypothetical protein